MFNIACMKVTLIPDLLIATMDQWQGLMVNVYIAVLYESWLCQTLLLSLLLCTNCSGLFIGISIGSEPLQRVCMILYFVIQAALIISPPKYWMYRRSGVWRNGPRNKRCACSNSKFCVIKHGFVVESKVCSKRVSSLNFTSVLPFRKLENDLKVAEEDGDPMEVWTK